MYNFYEISSIVSIVGIKDDVAQGGYMFPKLYGVGYKCKTIKIRDFKAIHIISLKTFVNRDLLNIYFLVINYHDSPTNVCN